MFGAVNGSLIAKPFQPRLLRRINARNVDMQGFHWNVNCNDQPTSHALRIRDLSTPSIYMSPKASLLAVNEMNSMPSLSIHYLASVSMHSLQQPCREKCHREIHQVPRQENMQWCCR